MHRSSLPTFVYGLAALIAAGSVAVPGKSQEPAPKKKPYERPVAIRFDGEINPLSEQSFYRKLSSAKALDADLLVIEIESPGGWVESSLNLAETLRKVDWAHTVAFIPEEAISGAAVMALGCDDIVMAPNALLGDAGEIFQDDQGFFQYVPEKARSYLASRLRVLAQAKGRSPALAEAMCDMDLRVFHVRNSKTGLEAFMSEQEIDAAEPGEWEKIKPVFATREKHFLTVNGLEALDLKLAQALLSTREEVEAYYQTAKPLVVLQPTGIDTTVVILNSALVTGLLFVLGLVALYFEFLHPGTCIGGLIAGLCFALFFWSRFLGGTAGWLELILFLAGLTFLAVELFILPGFFVAGLLGMMLLVTSLIMASQTFVIPQTSRELNTTLTQLGTVVGAGIVFLGAAITLSRYLGSIPIARSLMLELPSSGSGNAVPAGTARTSEPARSIDAVVIGDQGIADSPLRPAGKAVFRGAYVDVVSDGQFVNRGKPVKIVEISGNRVVVREVETS